MNSHDGVKAFSVNTETNGNHTDMVFQYIDDSGISYRDVEINTGTFEADGEEGGFVTLYSHDSENSRKAISLLGYSRQIRLHNGSTDGVDNDLILDAHEGITMPNGDINTSGKTKSDGGFETGNFRVEHNSNTDSLDFNYIG
jgi:hypothetical protein